MATVAERPSLYMTAARSEPTFRGNLHRWPIKPAQYNIIPRHRMSSEVTDHFTNNISFKKQDYCHAIESYHTYVTKLYVV